MCERIKTKHPDILERQVDGPYRYQLGSPEMNQGSAFLTCQRVADATGRVCAHWAAVVQHSQTKRCLSESRWV